MATRPCLAVAASELSRRQLSSVPKYEESSSRHDPADELPATVYMSSTSCKARMFGNRGVVAGNLNNTARDGMRITAFVVSS